VLADRQGASLRSAPLGVGLDIGCAPGRLGIYRRLVGHLLREGRGKAFIAELALNRPPQ